MATCQNVAKNKVLKHSLLTGVNYLRFGAGLVQTLPRLRRLSVQYSAFIGLWIWYVLNVVVSWYQEE